MLDPPFRICGLCSQVADESQPLSPSQTGYFSSLLELAADEIPTRVCADCHGVARDAQAFKYRSLRAIKKLENNVVDEALILGKGGRLVTKVTIKKEAPTKPVRDKESPEKNPVKAPVPHRIPLTPRKDFAAGSGVSQSKRREEAQRSSSSSECDSDKENYAPPREAETGQKRKSPEKEVPQRAESPKSSYSLRPRGSPGGRRSLRIPLTPNKSSRRQQSPERDSSEESEDEKRSEKPCPASKKPRSRSPAHGEQDPDAEFLAKKRYYYFEDHSSQAEAEADEDEDEDHDLDLELDSQAEAEADEDEDHDLDLELDSQSDDGDEKGSDSLPAAGPFECEVCKDKLEGKEAFLAHIIRLHQDDVDDEVLNNLEKDIQQARKNKKKS